MFFFAVKCTRENINRIVHWVICIGAHYGADISAACFIYFDIICRIIEVVLQMKTVDDQFLDIKIVQFILYPMKQKTYMGSPTTIHRYKKHLSRHELEIECLRINLHNLNILCVCIVKFPFRHEITKWCRK